jgi:hypothetical protein
MKIRALLLAVLLIQPALAANTATWSWTATTTYTDSTIIPATVPVTYELFTAIDGKPYTITATNIQGTTYITSGYADGSTVCGYLIAVANGNASSPSQAACKSFKVPPGALRNFHIGN